MTLLVNDDVWSFDLSRALEEVSPERRELALRHRLERDRRLSVAAYLLLKGELCRRYGRVASPVLARESGGKPYLRDFPEVHFNLSHCARAAVCAVSDRPVGVDVEAIAPVDEAVARCVLSEAEWASVRASPAPEVTFARYWTMKEALVKLTGAGLADDTRLPSLLAHCGDIDFETRVNEDRGWVVTSAQAFTDCKAPVLRNDRP